MTKLSSPRKHIYSVSLRLEEKGHCKWLELEELSLQDVYCKNAGDCKNLCYLLCDKDTTALDDPQTFRLSGHSVLWDSYKIS